MLPLQDEALLRPGRLEVQVEIGLPDDKGRLQILKESTCAFSVHMQPGRHMQHPSCADSDVHMAKLPLLMPVLIPCYIRALYCMHSASFQVERPWQELSISECPWQHWHIKTCIQAEAWRRQTTCLKLKLWSSCSLCHSCTHSWQSWRSPQAAAGCAADPHRQDGGQLLPGKGRGPLVPGR